MYLSLLKWSFYTRIKRRFLNLKIFEAFRQELLILLFVILQFTKCITVFIITNLILNNNYISIDNIYIDTILKRLQSNKSLLLILFVVYVLIEVYRNSIKAVKLNEDSKIKRWILANTNAEKSKVTITLILEYIIYSSLEIITLQLPIISLILIKLKYNVFITIILSLFYIAIIILLTILNSLIYNIYLYWVKSLKSIKIIIIKNIVSRIVFIIMFYFLGKSLSNWMNEFPLIHRKVQLTYFENWINKFKLNFIDEIMLNLNNSLNSLININKVYLIIIMILIIICLLSCIAMLSFFHKNNSKTFKKNNLINKSKSSTSLLWYSIKTIINSNYSFRNINAFFGNIYYWCSIGFYTGILKNIDTYSKVYYFLIISYIFYPSYFLIEYIFQNLTSKCCIDGEGKNIYFWINNNMFKNFKYKRLFFLVDTFLIAIITNLIINIFNNISLQTSLCAFITQIIFIYTLYNLFSISSIVFPHFEYSSIEELNVYEDRKQLSDTISFVILIIGIPIFVLPTVLYLTDYIKDITVYTIIQFIIMGVVLILINIILNIFIKKKVNSKEFIYSIFEGR